MSLVDVANTIRSLFEGLLPVKFKPNIVLTKIWTLLNELTKGDWRNVPKTLPVMEKRQLRNRSLPSKTLNSPFKQETCIAYDILTECPANMGFLNLNTKKICVYGKVPEYYGAKPKVYKKVEGCGVVDIGMLLVYLYVTFLVLRCISRFKLKTALNWDNTTQTKTANTLTSQCDQSGYGCGLFEVKHLNNFKLPYVYYCNYEHDVSELDELSSSSSETSPLGSVKTPSTEDTETYYTVPSQFANKTGETVFKPFNIQPEVNNTTESVFEEYKERQDATIRKEKRCEEESSIDNLFVPTNDDTVFKTCKSYLPSPETSDNCGSVFSPFNNEEQDDEFMKSVRAVYKQIPNEVEDKISYMMENSKLNTEDIKLPGGINLGFISKVKSAERIGMSIPQQAAMEVVMDEEKSVRKHKNTRSM